MMRITLVLLAVANFALFGIALRVLFARERRTPLATRLMVGVGLLVSCLHVYSLATAPLPTTDAVAAGGLYVLAGALFSWAAHSVHGRGFRLAYVPNSPNAVFTGGPYRWFRHPLYLSYTLARLRSRASRCCSRLPRWWPFMLVLRIGRSVRSCAASRETSTAPIAGKPACCCRNSCSRRNARPKSQLRIGDCGMRIDGLLIDDCAIALPD